jgi:hypothetical protein
MKGKVIPWKQDFAGAVDSTVSPIRLWHVRYEHLNFESPHNYKSKELYEDFQILKRKMQDVKLAFMENKIERHFQ